MKKYLSLIGALALGATTSLSVIACGNNTPPQPKPRPAIENIKQWSNQTSNIAKSLILSKSEQFNTNRLLNNVLNSNISNISNDKSSESNGASYDKFKNIWGYKNNIDGVTANDFISNTDNTFDNNQVKIRNDISDNIKKIQGYFALVLPALEDPNAITNKDIYNMINGFILKGFVSDALWNLHGSNINQEIKQYLPMIETITNNLDSFNPEKVLGSDYHKDDIAKSLFGENGNDGWLSHYQTTTGFKSEAVAKKSSILKSQNFTNWDQVALFKSSIDLNGFVSKLSGKTFGEIFNSAITYNGKEAVDFDFDKFASEIETIWSSSPENILNLISNLIPIVKYQFFGINPTSAITKISTTEKTNKEQGIINIKDIFSNIEKILFTKEGFTNFISNLFFSKSGTEFNLSNYATFDFTCNGKSLTETLSPIKNKINTKLGSLYEKIEAEIKKYHVQEIINTIKEDLSSLTTNFEFALTDLQNILNILNTKGLWDFFEKINQYQDKDAMLKDWDALWGTLGLQNNGSDDFIKDSVLDKAKKFLVSNPKFLSYINNVMSTVNKIATDSINTLIKQETTANIDFNNATLWSVGETTIKYDYDETTNETTITYNLINKLTPLDEKTYTVTIVVQGNASLDPGTTKHQVWLKSLNNEI